MRLPPLRGRGSIRMAKYDIVMLSAGRKELTEACVRSVVLYSKDYRLIWIDNAPDAGRDIWHDFMGKTGAWAQCMRVPMQENIGYTKGTNVGLAISTAPYVVLLNDDTEVPEGWLEKLEEAFAIQKLAAVGPLSTSQRQWQGQFPEEKGFQVVPTKFSLRGTKAIGGRPLAFFCTMISREAIEAIGYLDERFSPGFAEDDDWICRATLLGWYQAVRTDLRVKHVHRATWNPQKVAELQARNCRRLREKYAGVLR